MREVPDALLVFPPFWDTASPYLSVPVLAAWMRRAGFRVEAEDLSIRCASALLTPRAMNDSLEDARRILARWPASRSAAERDAFAGNLSLCSKVWEMTGDRLLAPFQPGGPKPRTVDDYTAFRRKLAWAFTIASTPFHPFALKVDGLVGDMLERLSSVRAMAGAGSGAPGMRHIEQYAREQARRGLPLIGISVAGPSQLVPALLIAKTVKAGSPETFVVIGGPHVPYIVDALRHDERIFDWVDAFVPGEGELPLMQLCAAIREGHDPSAVRGLLLRRRGCVVSSGPADRVNIAEIPPPDFTGFEPDRYLGNSGCLPLTFARGCSWSRCSFCTQHICFDGYRAMETNQIVEHVTETVARHGVSALAINDENLTPRRLRELATIVRTHCPEVRWQALARLTPRLADPVLARELAGSGCAMLSMGLESADQSVLDMNRKGIHSDKVPEILRALHDAGIWLNVFLVFGLPGERPETAFGTIEFLFRNRDRVDSFSPTVFRLEKGSPIAADMETYGITPDDIPADHCDSEIPVRETRWLTKPEAMVCLEAFIDGLVGSPQCPVEQADLNGQFLLQMLAARGVGAMREEMQRRADATREACALLEHDQDAFRRWWPALELEDLDPADPNSCVALSLPDRGTFFTLQRTELLLLSMRALGIDLNLLRRGFGKLLTDDVEQAGLEWGITASVLLLLSSRLVQESAAYGKPIRALQLFDATREIGTFVA